VGTRRCIGGYDAAKYFLSNRRPWVWPTGSTCTAHPHSPRLGDVFWWIPCIVAWQVLASRCLLLADYLIATKAKYKLDCAHMTGPLLALAPALSSRYGQLVTQGITLLPCCFLSIKAAFLSTLASRTDLDHATLRAGPSATEHKHELLLTNNSIG
jgi:hypothetical protein